MPATRASDADGEIRPGRNNKDFSEQSYGAHFAEIGVRRL
jgi:xanthine dehydrogenase YagR molybdenum-binding subunit